MTTTKLAYWLNGTAYCPECTESESSPCMSQAERERATISEGIGTCGCCGKSFADDVDEESN